MWLLAIGVLMAAGLASAKAGETLQVGIEGLNERLRDNVAAFLEINQLAGKPLPNEARLRWLHSRAEQDIRRALEPFGYYRPQIDASLERTASGWQARYRVDAGPPLRVATLELQVLGEGSNDPAFKKILANPPLKKGQALEHGRYEEIKQAFQGLATERGYFNARLLVSEVRVDLEAYKADVIVHYDTGERYHFGQITFHQDALAPEFLRRYLDIQPGDPYQVDSLLKLQSDLIDSDYFSQVEVNASPDQALDHTLPVNVNLEPRKSSKYTIGLGFGTDTGPRVRLGIQRPWINRWGHRLDAELLASAIQYGIAGKYIIPGADPRTDSFALRAGLTQEKSDIKDSLTAIIGVSQQHQYGSWLRIAALNYQRETFKFKGEEEQTVGLLIPSVDWTYVKTDNRLRATNGVRFNLKLQGAYEPLLSDLSFLQAAVRTKWIKTLTVKNRLILRGDAGTTWASDFDKLPSTLRFFAGGDSSVRGYSLDSIGPENARGEVIGAKNLLVASLEYEHRIRDNWALAAFIDNGDAFDGGSPQFKTGVGFGVRWFSPVGPVRVDLASGLDEPGDAIRLHLSIGPDL